MLFSAQLDSTSASKGGPDSPTALKKKIAELETKLKSAQSSSSLQKENADLKKQVDELKSKKPLAAGSRSVSGDAASIKQELEDTIAKHELLEEEYVVAKAKLQMERDEMKVLIVALSLLIIFAPLRRALLNFIEYFRTFYF